MGEDPPWVIVPLAKSHLRDAFDSGEPALDGFLRRSARQDQDRDFSRTFVAVRPGDRRVLGFFTLSAGRVAAESVPEEDRKRLPRYPVPVVHLGRLAVDRSARGQGLGEALLVRALETALRVSGEIGAHAVEVRAKGEAARALCVKYGFRALVDDPLHLYLSMKAIRAALERGAGA